MIPDGLLEKWVNEGIISVDTAQKMQNDIEAFRKEKRSSKIIACLSTLGSILLGIGVILFIASNWRTVSHTVKTILLTICMLFTYWLGCECAFFRKTLPKAGASLLLLSALLFGTSLFVVTQAYHFPANHHLLPLIWLLAVLPMVYLTRLQLIAVLASILYFLWMILFFRSYESHLIILILYSALFLISFGGIHYMIQPLTKIARAYRITGINVAFFCLFMLTFREISAHHSNSIARFAETSPFLTFGLWVLAISISALALINFVSTPHKLIPKIEAPLIVCVLVTTAFYYSSSTGSSLYTAVFNFLFFACCLTISITVYLKEDMRRVDISILWLIFLITARYFDFCWKLLPRSIFFAIGGSVLVAGGILFEKQRKKLKEKFSS
ncbi:DUF2157 domain-containing protein [bacterium]|nr:DUF2157 domain-containing protein [bacterium]